MVEELKARMTCCNQQSNAFSRKRRTRSSCECGFKTHVPGEILPRSKMSDLPSLPKTREQIKPIKLPKKEAETLFAAGKQLRQTASSLYQELDKQTPPYRFNRFTGQSICVPVLQALAAEYLLKGLSVRENGTCRQTHDLYDLYEALNPKTQAYIAALGMSRNRLDMPEFRKAH